MSVLRVGRLLRSDKLKQGQQMRPLETFLEFPYLSEDIFPVDGDTRKLYFSRIFVLHENIEAWTAMLLGSAP